jgi:competence ComEA-like helix-hairpin-helix protein
MPKENSISELRNAGHGEAVRARGWILILVIVGLWIGAGQLWRRGERQRPIAEAAYTVDINQANEMDLLNLPEVGPSLARKILSYREQHGDFHALSELGEVPGVGPQTLKQLAPFLTFTTQSNAANDDTILTAQSRERIAP